MDRQDLFTLNDFPSDPKKLTPNLSEYREYSQKKVIGKSNETSFAPFCSFKVNREGVYIAGVQLPVVVCHLSRHGR